MAVLIRETLKHHAEDLKNLDVKKLARKMTGYTMKVPGTKAAKSRIRRILLAMVRQIEIETTEPATLERPNGEKSGDVPCLFGTLTTQRYHWDQLIGIIAQVERDMDPNFPEVASLSKSKRRELVNKYPLVVAWFCALRLEMVLKTVVVPIFQATTYAAVFEWSPTGGMVHLHYIIWKRDSPRFDRRSEDLVARAKVLQKQGLIAAAEVKCDITDVLDYFSEYINEWNPNKDEAGKFFEDCVPGPIGQDLEEHPAALDMQSLLELLKPESSEARLKYYRRCVQKEHLHDYHYPNPLGPPNILQPCAQLLKGTNNMVYCKNN